MQASTEINDLRKLLGVAVRIIEIMKDDLAYRVNHAETAESRLNSEAALDVVKRWMEATDRVLGGEPENIFSKFLQERKPKGRIEVEKFVSDMVRLALLVHRDAGRDTEFCAYMISKLADIMVENEDMTAEIARLRSL